VHPFEGRTNPRWDRLRGERMNQRRTASLILISSDVVLALAGGDRGAGRLGYQHNRRRSPY
jgi:hypothetical protein